MKMDVALCLKCRKPARAAYLFRASRAQGFPRVEAWACSDRECGVWVKTGRERPQRFRDSRDIGTMSPFEAFALGSLWNDVKYREPPPEFRPLAEAPRAVKEALASFALDLLAKPEPKDPKPC